MSQDQEGDGIVINSTSAMSSSFLPYKHIHNPLKPAKLGTVVWCVVLGVCIIGSVYYGLNPLTKVQFLHSGMCTQHAALESYWEVECLGQLFLFMKLFQFPF